MTVADLRNTLDFRSFKDLAMSLCLGFTPFVIVGALSKFQSRQSTSMERGFTISWIVVSVLFGPIYKFFYQILDPDQRMAFAIVFAIVFGTPAIGGMVVVGKMIKDFGACSLIG
jgi:hypothetical protein